MEIVEALLVYLVVTGLVSVIVLDYGYGRIPGVHRDSNRFHLATAAAAIPIAYLVWSNGWSAFAILVVVMFVLHWLNAGGWFDKNRGRPTNP
jgi:hypothetical protein